MRTLKIKEVKDLPKVTPATILVIDTECTGLDKMLDKPFLILITVKGKSWALADIPKAVKWLNVNMPIAAICAFHNAKYDLHQLINVGLKDSTMDQSTLHCTYIAETLLDDTRFSYKLGDLGKERFGIDKKDTELLQWCAEKFGGKPTAKKQGCNYHKAPIELVAYYGVGDTELTEKLYIVQGPELDLQNLNRVFNLEMAVVKAVVRMERTGVPVNLEAAAKGKKKFEIEKAKLSEKLIELVGFDVNVNSGKQQKEAFEIMGLSVTINDLTGNPTFAKGILEGRSDKLSGFILQQREYRTLIEMFLGRFPDHAYDDGRIRGDFNQTMSEEYGTITGRFSSSNPNMQQIPKRDKEKSAIVRGVFYAPKGMNWMTVDWSQFEFRVMMHYCKAKHMLAAYHKNPDLDYHQLVADMVGITRDLAKPVNLGLMYGMGKGLMAKNCGMPYTMTVKKGKARLKAGPEAEQIFETYHAQVPEVRMFMKAAEKRARRRGYIITIDGRKIRFHDLNKAFRAGCYIIQGSSAGLLKKKMVLLDNEFKNTSVELMLTVHDEFDLLVPKGSETTRAKKIVTEIMQDVPELNLPIRCDIGIGKNWWEASK